MATEKTEAPRGADQRRRRHWFKLDNAAILFPTFASGTISTLFRLSMTLDEPIRLSTLEAALERVHPCFPYFNVELHAGAFWYYFETISRPPRVMADSKYPCMNLRLRDRGRYLFRVRAYDRRVAVEFSHILTDGTGASIFLKSLVAEYLRLRGVAVAEDPTVFRPGRVPEDEEFEDAFKRYCDPSLPWPEKEKVAFHIPARLERRGVYHVVGASMPLAPLLALARERRVSLTEFLAAVQVAALQDLWEALPERSRRRKPALLKLMVPINLRKPFPSRTMRNFSLFALPGVDRRLGHFEFEEIVQEVHHSMRLQGTPREVARQITRNVTSTRNAFVRAMPLFLKILGGRALYKRFGELLYSSCLTNLGALELPEGMRERVTRADFVSAPAPLTGTNCAMLSLGDRVYLSFARLARESELERLFFTRLRRMGIPVKLESND